MLSFSNSFQLKYLEKDEFKDVPRLTKIKLDGNQLSVVIDHLFEAQKGLEYLGSHKKYCSKLCIRRTKKEEEKKTEKEK